MPEESYWVKRKPDEGFNSSALIMAYLQQAKLLEFRLWWGIREPLEIFLLFLFSVFGAQLPLATQERTHAARTVHHILEAYALHFGKFILNGLSTVAFNDAFAMRHSCIFLQGGRLKVRLKAWLKILKVRVWVRVGAGLACCTMLCSGFGFSFGSRQQLNPRDTNAKPNATQPFTKLIYGTSWQRKH